MTDVTASVTELAMERDVHPLLAYAASSGQTVTAIAKAAGCSRMTLYRLINGEQNATLDLLRRVSAATNGEVPVGALMPSDFATAPVVTGDAA